MSECDTVPRNSKQQIRNLMTAENEQSCASLVSAQWLKKHLHDTDVRVVDASWHLPATGRDARAEFDDSHIPGAVFFDIDAHSAPGPLPHMMPDTAQFSSAAGSLGIAEHHRIVVYDSIGVFSAARVWWMFRYFGASRVSVLNGGLPAWLRAADATGGLTSDADEQTEELASSSDEFGESPDTCKTQGAFTLVDSSEVFDAMNAKRTILDARSAARFSGAEKEAREGLRSGHIPGSISLPFTQVLDAQGCLKNAEALGSLFAGLGLEREDRIITTCGSGVTAAVLSLALDCAGYHSVALYDGSWSEWGGLSHTPVATGQGSAR